MVERRKYKRFKIEKADAGYHLVDFTFWAESRSKGSGLLRNISLGGVSFSSDDILPEDALLNLELRFGETAAIGDVLGRIVRAKKVNDNGYEIGVNFSWWGREKDKKTMVKLLEEN